MNTTETALGRLEELAIEVPSWAYGNSGTRFKVFGTPGHPADGPGEARRRREGARSSPGSRPPWRCTSRGTRSTTTPPCRRTPRTSACGLGHDQLQHVPGRRLQVRQPDPRRPGGPPQGDRPPPRVHRDDERRPGSRDLKIWLADGTNYPGQDDMRGRQDRLAESPARDLRRTRRGPAAGAGVQVLRAGVLPHRRAGLGHLLRPGRRPWASGRWSAWTPATTRRAPTSSSSSCSCCGSASSARSTSTPASTPTTT